MGEYHIVGGNRLVGELDIIGAKNAVLPILASVVLNKDESVIHNCPLISDTQTSIQILEALGCKVKVEDHTLIVDSSTANQCQVPEKLVSEMRSSVIFMGGLLGRFGKVEITYPGGCGLGKRPINFHMDALKQLGAEICESDKIITCTAKKLKGAKIVLDYPSVGATENIMLAAVFAEGVTEIHNAAREPEIVDLQDFLVGMGAKIIGAGTGRIFIDGVKRLHPVVHRIIPDRIVTGTLLAAGAVTKGELTIHKSFPGHLRSTLEVLSAAGCQTEVEGSSIRLKGPERLKPVARIETEPFPGFPTDMQPQIMSMLSVADGTSIIYESVFESRYKHAVELNKLNANIDISEDKRTFTIKGVNKLQGGQVESADLRGGAALILAGLCAEGNTVVKNSNFVERGYEHIEEVLHSVGADIILRC